MNSQQFEEIKRKKKVTWPQKSTTLSG